VNARGGGASLSIPQHLIAGAYAEVAASFGHSGESRPTIRRIISASIGLRWAMLLFAVKCSDLHRASVLPTFQRCPLESIVSGSISIKLEFAFQGPKTTANNSIPGGRMERLMLQAIG
jgi:hypothetical protein